MKISDVSLHNLRGNDPADANQDAYNQTIDCRTWGGESFIFNTSFDERVAYFMPVCPSSLRHPSLMTSSSLGRLERLHLV